MKVCLVQSQLVWEDPDANREMLAAKIRSATQNADLYILPEMFTTGFTMKPESQAEPDGLVTQGWMKALAREKNAVVVGSVAVKGQDKFYNRLYWVRPDGTLDYYDKRHLFRMGGEDQHYTAGNQRLIVKHGDWNLMCTVCYDLRFPVWSRNRYNAQTREYEYDIMLCVANWPAVRSYAWKHLLIARAIENQCYVIGVNRVGPDGHGVAHNGDSVLIGPKGEVLTSLAAGEEQLGFATLDRASLLDFRAHFPAGLDSDAFYFGENPSGFPHH